MDDNQPFSYAQLLAHHQKARAEDPDVVPEDLPTFSSQLNALTGSHDYDAGLVDNPVRRVASGYQEGTKWLGPEEGKALGLGFNQLVESVRPGTIPPDWQKVAPDALEGLGKIVPDLLVSKGVEAATKAVRLPIPVPATLSALAGARTYADTGSATQAATNALATGASFLVGNPARNYALRKTGAETLGELAVQTTPGGQMAADALAKVAAASGDGAVAEAAKRLIPATISQWLAAHAAGAGAMLGVQQLGSSAQRMERGESPIPSAQELVTSLAGQLPYSIWEGATQGTRPISYEAKQIVEQSKKNFKSDFKETAKATGYDPTSEDLNAAYNRVLRRAGLDIDGVVLNSVKNEAYIDPDYAAQVSSEAYMAKKADNIRKRDLELTLALKGEATDVSKLSEGEQTKYADLIQQEQRRDLTPDEQEQLAGLSEAAKTTGDVNPEIQKRVAAISGSPAERGTSPNKRNLVERFQGLQWLKEYDANKDKERAGQQGADELLNNPADAQKAATLHQITDLEDQGRYDEAEPLYDTLDQTELSSSSEKGAMSNYKQLLPEQTRAAHHAALAYKQPVDWNNPKSINAFEKYVYKAMSNAELEAARSRSGEQSISEHATREEAQLNAKFLNENADKQEGFVYGVPKRPNGQGKFVVKKYSYDRTTQLIEEWKQDITSGGKLDFEDYLRNLESGELFQGPVRTEDTFAGNIEGLKQVKSPAQREALYSALTKNALSAVKSMDPDEVARVVGARRNDKNVIGRRLSRWMEFLNQGGKVDLAITKEPEREVLGVFHNELEAQRFIQSVNEDVLGAKTSLALETRDLNAEDGANIGKAYAVTKAKEGGGKVTGIRASKQKVVAGQKSQLEQLNEFLGDLGYSDPADLNQRKNSKMNFFEQMNALGHAVAAKFQNPDDLFTRPAGEFGYDVGVIEGRGGALKVYGGNSYASSKGTHNFVYQTRNGQRKTYTHDGSVHALLGLLSKLRQDQGVVEASVIGDLLGKMDDKDVPADLKAALQVLTKTPGAQKINFGVALAKNKYGEWDPTVRGWYNHMQGVLQGGVGGMLSPYYRDPFTGRVTWLKPDKLAAVLVHELVHGNTSIALWNDPGLRAEVKVLHDYVREQYDIKKKTNELVGLDFQSLLGLDEDTVAQGGRPDQMSHGVDEFFSEMWSNPELRKFVWSLEDKPELFGSMPERSVKQLSMFHRFWESIKTWMSKAMGTEATTLADRVQQMQERVMMTQNAMGQLHNPKYDIYETLAKAIYQPGDLVVTRPELRPGKGDPIIRSFGREEGNFVLPQDKPIVDLERHWMQRPAEGEPFNEETREPAVEEEPASTTEPEPLTTPKPNLPKVSPSSKTPEQVDMAHKLPDRREAPPSLKQVNIKRDIDGNLTLDRDDVDIRSAMYSSNHEFLRTEGEGKAQKWIWKQLPTPEASPENLTLQSRQPIDTATVKHALKYGASDWFDDTDGSWNFKPQHDGHDFLGWWGLEHGTDYKDNGERVAISPEGQRRLAQILATEQMRANATEQFQTMPQFVSGFSTIQSVYEQAGYTPRQSQQMATLMTRYLFAWRQPERFVLGETNEPRVGGLAYRGGEHAALQTNILSTYRRESPEDLARITKQTVLHELLHLADSDSVLTSLAKSMTPEDRALLINVVNEVNEVSSVHQDNWEASVNKPVEFAADFAARMYAGLVKEANPSVVLKDYLMYTDDNVKSILSDLFKTQHETVDNFMKSMDQEGSWYHRLGVQSLLFTRNLMRPIQEVEMLTTKALQMRWLYPDEYYGAVDAVNKQIEQAQIPKLPMTGAGVQATVLHSVVPAGTEVREVLALEPNTKLSWWNKTLTRFHMLAQQYPDLRPVWNAIDVANRMAHESAVKIQSVLIGRTAANNVDDRGIRKDVQAFLKSDDMQSAFSKVALEMQIAGEKGAELTPDQRLTMLSRYIKDPEQRRIINHVAQATLEQNRLVANAIVRGHRSSAELVIAIATRKYLRGAMDVEQARQFSSTMFKYFDAAISGRGSEANDLQMRMSAMLPNTKALSELIGTGQDLYARYDAETGKLNGGLVYERDFLNARSDWWMTERRFGDYGLYYRNGAGDMASMWFKSMGERDKFAKGKPDVRLIDNDGDSKSLGLNENLINRLSMADQRQMERLRDALDEDQMNQLGLNVDLAGELRAAMLAQDVSNTSIRRRHAPGREFLSMYDNQQIYHSSTVNALKNKQMKLEVALALTNPIFDQQPDLKKTAVQHLSNVLAPDTEWGRRISTANFTYFLMGNVSNMILEPFQQLMSLAPSLVENGDGIVQSYKRLFSANKDALAHRVGKKSYSDVGLTAAVLKAREEGIVDHGLLAELDYHPDLNYVNSLRAINGRREYGLFDLLKNKAYTVANLGRQFYAMMPALNSEVSFVAAYRQEYAKSKNAQAAYEKAAFVTRNAMFGSGKIGRPVGIFSMGGTMGRTASQAMYSLQSYNTSMMTLMGYYVKKSFSPKGLSAAQTTQVRKAAVQALGTQMALAGALGMPFVQGAIATLDQFMPGVNWDQTVRDFLTGWIPDDTAMGGFLRDFVAKGLPSATQHGPDMGSRFALGGTLGVSPYNGIGMEYAFGPTASLATNLVQGAQKALAGDPIKGAKQMLPNGIQRIIDAAQQGRDFRNKKGDLLLNDMSGLEMAGRAAGFTPNRAARLQDASRLSSQETLARNAKMGPKVDKWADMWVNGEAEKVRQEVLDEEVKSQGQEKARDLIHAIAGRVEKKTMLQDPRELGNRASAQSTDAFLRLMQQGGQTVPSQVDRLQKRDEVGTSLGLPSGMTRERVGHSSAIDRLMQMNPALSRATAALALEHPTRQSTYQGLNYGQQSTQE